MSTFYYPKITSSVDLERKVLVVPVVSIANVSQLAADLLISSLGLHRVGIFDPRDVVPVVGARDDGEEGITTPLELYGNQDIDVVVIQQRSPALKNRKDEFVQDVLTFIQHSKFAAVLFLSGVDMSNRTDDQMLTPTYHIHPPNTPSWDSTLLSRLSQLQIPTYTSPVSQRPFAGASRENETGIPFIPGGGLTRRFLSSLPQPWSTPTTSLLQFVLEGDNREDAKLMANVVAKILHLDSKISAWRQPRSWDRGLFGTPQDQTLYG